MHAKLRSHEKHRILLWRIFLVNSSLMGFFFRKRVNFGPFRLNFSKSGLGGSFGVKGVRISSGPSGTYIHAGVNGFYYKQRIHKVSPRKSGPTSIFGSAGTNDSTENDRGITTDISSKKLLEEINARIQLKVPTNLVVTICLTVMLILSIVIRSLMTDPRFSLNVSPFAVELIKVGLPLLMISFGTLLILRYYAQYKKDRTSKLFYELKGESLNRFNWLSHACEILSGSRSVWRIATLANDCNQALDVRKEQPPFIRTNVDVWGLDSNRISTYFLPDYIFVWMDKKYHAVPYEQLTVHFRKDSYLSTSTPPADATIIGYRFQHTRKDGGRDLRYKYNPAYPIVESGFIALNSRTGFKLQLQVSNVNAAKFFVETINSLTNQPSATSHDSKSSSRGSHTNERTAHESRYESSNNQKKAKEGQTLTPEIKSAFAILEVHVGASKEVVQAAWRGMAKSYHPDKVAQHSPRIAKLAEEKMKEINRAFEILKRAGLA